VTAGPDEPTGVMPEDDDEPTGRLDRGEEPTERLEGGDGDPPTENLPEGSADPNDRFDSARTAGTEEMRVRGLASGDLPPEYPTDPTMVRDPGDPGDPSHPPTPRPVDESRGRGIWMLVASIAAALILVGVYIAAGGLDYKPAKAADPCDAREWTNPGNLEETAQQFALSAMDGAACELGVSREELTRALSSDEARAQFAEEKGLSDTEIEEAVRSGLNRAIDDAEDAGAINSLLATGFRAAVRVMPIDQMIPLLEDASGFLSGDSLDDLGGLIDGVVDSLGGGSGDAGSNGEGSNGFGDQLQDAVPDDLSDQLPEDITDGLRNQLPDDVQREIPDSVDESIQRGLDNLLNP